MRLRYQYENLIQKLTPLTLLIIITVLLIPSSTGVTYNKALKPFREITPPYSVEELRKTIEETSNIPEVEYKGVLTPSNLTSEELSKGLLKNLIQYSDVFIQAEQETGINAVFLASISALESGWGESYYNNNIYGWMNSKGLRPYDSVEECILNVSHNLKNLYLTEDGVYFNGYEVSDVNVKYCGTQHWEDSVNQIMKDIQRRIENE